MDGEDPAFVIAQVLDDGHRVDNPVGLTGAPNPENSFLNTVLGLLILAAVVSLVVRFRRSRGEERLQLKWFTYACAVLPVLLLGDLLPDSAGNVLFAVGITALIFWGILRPIVRNWHDPEVQRRLHELLGVHA